MVYSSRSSLRGRQLTKGVLPLNFTKRLTALTLSAAVAASLAAAPAHAAGYPDMPQGWSKAAMESAVANGLLGGDDQGRLNPQDSLTRAEMAVILGNVLGAAGLADLSGFSDVAPDAWYRTAMARAVHMGILAGVGGGLLDPERPATRQEVFVVLAQALRLEGADPSVLDRFPDAGDIADWAVGAAAALVESGRVVGTDGKLMPRKIITREEFAQLIYNLFGDYIGASGAYSGSYGRSLAVRADGVTLKDAHVAGDLVIGDGVGEGHITLENVTVEGRLVVRGGGENSVVVTGDSRIAQAVISRRNGGVRLSVEGTASVDTVLVDHGSGAVKLEGSLSAVTVDAPGASVEITGQVDAVVLSESAAQSSLTVAEGAQVGSVTASAQEGSLTVSGTVEQVSVTGSADGTSVRAESGAAIGQVTTAGSNTTVEGDGSVGKVEAAPGSTGTTVSTGGTQVENNSGEAVTTPGGSVESGSSGTTEPGQGGSSGGSGGSGGSGEPDGPDGGGAEEPAPTPDPGALIGAVQSAPSYVYDDFTYTGSFTSSAEGAAVTVESGYTLTQVIDGTAMNDMARFLGALYRQDGGAAVQAITHLGVRYTWANGDNAVNLGSNWVRDPDAEAADPNTLVSALVDEYQAGQVLSPLTLHGPDGAEAALNLALTATVNSQEELAVALAGGMSTIPLGADFEVDSKISLSRPVTLEGGGHTITASEGWTGDDSLTKHLLGIESDGVTLRDLTLDSAGRAYGVQAYDSAGAVLENVAILNSAGSGLGVNGSSLTAAGLTVSGSGWEQSIDVTRGEFASGPSVLVLTGAVLSDPLGIMEDVPSAQTPASASVTVDGQTWSSFLYTYEDGARFKQVYAANAGLIAAVQLAPGYQYGDDYAYTGGFTSAVTAQGVAVSAQYSPAQLADGTAMNDMARLLGALHRQDEGASIRSITYGGQVYLWANGAHAVNLGSNWVRDPDADADDGNTLISAIVDDYQEDPGIFPLTLTLTDGAGNTLELTLEVALSGN